MKSIPYLVFTLLILFESTQSQFGFFEQMFGGGGHQQQQNHQQQQQQQNVPSDSAAYRHNYENYYCDNYLCPDTLACVHFPHHCPCPWPDHEDKFELADGQRMCISKGGFKSGDAERKVQLTRQGLL